MKEGYVPSHEDLVRLETPTQETQHDKLQYRNQFIQLLDFSGSRTSRASWAGHFERVDAIIFVIGLSDSDTPVDGFTNMNQLQEGMFLWESLAYSVFFKKSKVYLFLNKVDVFERKLKTSLLSDHFPAFKGTTFQDACDWVKSDFLSRHKQPHRVNVHFTTSVDTGSMQRVLTSAFDDIVAAPEIQSTTSQKKKLMNKV